VDRMGITDYHKHLYRLYYVDGLTYQEIADKQEITRQRVNQIILRINEKVRERLNRNTNK